MRIALRELSSRFAFFVCGLITFGVGRVHADLIRHNLLMTGLGNPEAVVLVVAAILAILIALVPSSWIGKTSNIDPTNQRRSSIPIKMLGGFGALAYVMVAGLVLIPPNGHAALDPALVFLICPACVLTVTADPSLGTVLLFLAPLNAAVYGAFGGILGYVVLAIRNRWVKLG